MGSRLIKRESEREIGEDFNGDEKYLFAYNFELEYKTMWGIIHLVRHA